MATVQYWNGSSWVDLETSTGVEANQWQITRGVSTVQIAPQATIDTAADAITTNTEVRIRDKSTNTTLFGGFARSGGRIGSDGTRQITIDGYGTKPLAEEWTVNYGGDDEGLLLQVFEGANAGNLTLQFQPTPQAISGTFSLEEVARKRTARDVMNLRDYVWRIDAAENVWVETKGGRGSIGSLTVGQDAVQVTEFESGSIETVVNKAIVKGKGSQSSISATATDTTSINTYGEQPLVFKSSWVADQTDAQNLADQLLTPDPLPQATLQIDPSELGVGYDSLVNYTVDVTDPNRGLSNATLRIEQQTVTEGGHELKVGAGSGIDIERQNQQTQSDDDAEVVDLDDVADSTNYARVAENGVTATGELLADAVNLQDSLGNLARSLQSVITDDGIKNKTVIDGGEILTGSITAAEILANTITANEIAAGSIDTTRLQVFDWIPVDLTFTDNSPGAGEISWNEHELVFDGTTYTISAGSTAQEFIYWQEGDGFYSTSNSKPTLADGDALIAVNDNGEAVQILQATIIDGGSIRTNSIQAAEIDAGTITATEIAAGTITAAEIAADTITASEIAADAITASEIAANTITASEILADTITASEIAANTITASEILADTITANELDALAIETGNLEVGDIGSNNTVEFLTDTFFGISVMVVKPNGGVSLGRSSDRYSGLFAVDIDGDGSLAIGSGASLTNVDDGEVEVVPDASGDGMRIVNDTGAVSVDDVSVQPNTDDDGMLGAGDGSTSSKAWQEVHTHNLYQYSPKPMADDPRQSSSGPESAPSVDLDSLSEQSWGDPPGYVQAGKTNGEYVDVPGAVEMSHMSNYLLEVCKAQQDVIDDLEERLSALEEQV